MEDKIYEVLRKHKLTLKKREDLMPDLLALFSDSNRFYVGFDGEAEVVSSNDNPLTKETAPRIKGYEIESENEGVITYNLNGV